MFSIGYWYIDNNRWTLNGDWAQVNGISSAHSTTKRDRWFTNDTATFELSWIDVELAQFKALDFDSQVDTILKFHRYNNIEPHLINQWLDIIQKLKTKEKESGIPIKLNR